MTIRSIVLDTIQFIFGRTEAERVLQTFVTVRYADTLSADSASL